MIAEVLIGVALAFLALAPGARGRARDATVRGRHLVAAFGLALALVDARQDLLKDFLVDGHAGALRGVFGAGGWIVIPLSLLIGAGLARTVRLAAAVAGHDFVQGLLRITVRVPGVQRSAAFFQDVAVLASPLAQRVATRASPRGPIACPAC